MSSGPDWRLIAPFSLPAWPCNFPVVYRLRVLSKGGIVPPSPPPPLTLRFASPRRSGPCSSSLPIRLVESSHLGATVTTLLFFRHLVTCHSSCGHYGHLRPLFARYLRSFSPVYVLAGQFLPRPAFTYYDSLHPTCVSSLSTGVPTEIYISPLSPWGESRTLFRIHRRT